jgi:hypothetical protein
MSDFFGKEMEMGQRLIVHVKEVIDFGLGDHEGMSVDDGAYIQEGQALVIFRYFEAGDLAGNDF